MRKLLMIGVNPVYAVVALLLAASIVYLLAQPRTYHKAPDEFTPERHLWPLAPTTKFSVKPIREAARLLQPSELVLGVAVGKEARAYPINMLNHEPGAKVVNDVVGGRPLMATWCDSAHNAIVYAREIDGVRHTFGVFGQIWKGSMVIYDQETMTHWSHILGEAKRGPLKGRTLSPIPALVTDWETWSRLHPQGTVAILSAGQIEYTRKIYDDPGPYLLGIAANGKAMAWNLSELQEQPVINDSWDERPVLVLFDHAHASACLYARTVKNQVLTFSMEGMELKDRETGTTWERTTGEATAGPLVGSRLALLPAIVSFRKIWQNFHPRSRE